MAQTYPIISGQPTGATAVTRYFPLTTYYASSAQTSSPPANSVIVGSGVLQNFFVDRKGTPPASGTTVTYDLLKNNNVTAVASITLNDTQSFGSDLVSSVSYTDGDLFCWRVKPSGSAGTGVWESSCEAVASTDGQCLVTGSSSTVLTATTTHYSNLQQDAMLTVQGSGSIMPFDGSFTKFCMNVSSAPTAGKDFTATLMKRTRATGAVASTGFTIQVAGSNTQTITSPTPISFLQGDIFWWETVSTGSPASNRISIASHIVPTIPGMSMHSWGTSSNSSPSQTTTAASLYSTVGGGNGSSESIRVVPAIGTYTMKNLTVWNELTPAGSNQVTFTSRANAVDIGTIVMTPSTSPLYLEDNTNQVTVNAYEKVGIRFQRTAGSGTATIGLVSAGFALYKAPASTFKPKTTFFM